MSRSSHATIAIAVAAILVVVAVSSGLAGCAQAPKPAPVLTVREVATPVAVACAPDVGPAPAYPDTDAALKAAPDLFARVRLLVLGRLARLTRERELNAALSACDREPQP